MLPLSANTPPPDPIQHPSHSNPDSGSYPGTDTGISDPQLGSPTLYVSLSGSDANDGRSEHTALRTIQRAADLAQPGDVISVKAGVYRERVRTVRSGESGKPIVFQGEPGAVIDGGTLLAAGGNYWTSVSTINGKSVTGTYRAQLGSPRHVTWNGKYIMEIDPSRVSDISAFFQDTIPGHSWDGIEALYANVDGWTYIRTRNRDNPNKATVTYSPRYGAGFTINGHSFITLRGFTVQGGHYGIWINDGNDNVVRDSLVRHGERTVLLQGNASRNKVHHNEVTWEHIWENVGYNAGRTAANGNQWVYMKRYGRYNHQAIFMLDVTGNDNHIHHNYVHNHWDGIVIYNGHHSRVPRLTQSERDSLSKQNQRFKIYGNTIHNMADSVLSIQTGGVDSEIYDNIIHEGTALIRLKGLWGGPLFIYRNQVSADTHSRWDGANLFTPGIFFSLGDIAHTPAELYVYHNTLAPGGWGVNFSQYNDSDPATEGLSGTRFINNVFSPSRALVSRNSNWGSTINAKFDYNYSANANTTAGWPSGDGNILQSSNLIWNPEKETQYWLPEGHPARNAGIDLSRPWTIDGITHPPLPGMNPGYFLGDQPHIGLTSSEAN